MSNDITALAHNYELLIANGQQTADLLRHLADNEIDSDYFAVVSECESYGQETEAELSITDFALRAAGYVDALVEALERARQHIARQEQILLNQDETLSIRLSELEGARMHIAALERANAAQDDHINQQQDRIDVLDKRLIEYAGIATREARRVAELEDENEYVRWRFKESDLLFAMLLITMRAAVIEKEHGEGDRAAMDWIINKLAGPGEFAPESETDAQAYFNRESEIIDSEFSACMDFFMKRNERLRAASIRVKGE